MLSLTLELSDLCETVRGILTGAGYPEPLVVDDPADISPPCVWVHLDSVESRRLGGPELSFSVDCVAPNLRAPAALAVLDGMASPLMATLGQSLPAVTAQLVAPGTGDPYPSIRLTVPTNPC